MTWAAMAVVLPVMALARPAWGVALYMLTFFAAPQLWWWGDELPVLRYSLWSGIILLVAVAVCVPQLTEDVRRRFTKVHWAALALVANAVMVHLVLAADPVTSGEELVELFKFTLLFFLIWGAIQDRRDFRLVLLTIALGAAYIGYEVTINERGDFNGARLEGVGAPGADSANTLANLLLITLPLTGSLFVKGTKLERLVVLISAPLALNVLILCNSRGAFLGLIGAGLTFLLLARGATRKKAIRSLALGSVVLYMLLGDPEIMDRFSTTFVGSEERDQSASSRLVFWEAGLSMIRDYPFGAGGDAFKFVFGGRYIQGVTGLDEANRSLHNGYLTEATSWGVQGLFWRLFFLGAAIIAALRTSNLCRIEGRVEDSLMGICVLVSALGFLIHCLFGSFMSHEWGYWIAALLVRYHELYQVADTSAEIGTPEGATASAEAQAAA